jgi:hypothetical protein
MISSVQVTGLRKPHPRVKFSGQEDGVLKTLLQAYGTDNWQEIAKNMPKRNMRQCRDRWVNYLSSEINTSPWTAEEDQLLLSKVQELGAAWKYIATFFKVRTDINVKNRWHLIQWRVRREIHFARPVELTKPDGSMRPKAVLDDDIRNSLWDSCTWGEDTEWEFELPEQ